MYLCGKAVFASATVPGTTQNRQADIRFRLTPAAQP